MDVAVQPAMLTREGGSKVTVFRSRDGERGIDTSITKFESPAKLDLISCNSFLGKFTPRFPDTTWRVVWGESVGTSDYSVFVDASTGQFLERMH